MRLEWCTGRGVGRGMVRPPRLVSYACLYTTNILSAEKCILGIFRYEYKYPNFNSIDFSEAKILEGLGSCTKICWENFPKLVFLGNFNFLIFHNFVYYQEKSSYLIQYPLLGRSAIYTGSHIEESKSARGQNAHVSR